MPGISTCRGGPPAPSAEAPPGFRPSSRPSSLPPPPVRHPNLRNSNRESLRLEFDVTQTKQTTQPNSNRENDALLRTGGPLAPPGFRPSVRPSSRRPPPARDPNLKNPNRESFLLEINATQTKQTPAVHSNREEMALFSTPGGAEKRAGLKTRPYDGNSELNSRKNNKKLPSFLFRLKPTPILCFVGLTSIFNRTTFRLRRIRIEPILRSNGAFPAQKRHRNPQQKTTKTPTRTPPKVFRVQRRPTLYFVRLTRNSTCTHVSGRRTIFRAQKRDPIDSFRILTWRQRRSQLDSRGVGRSETTAPRSTQPAKNVSRLKAPNLQQLRRYAIARSSFHADYLAAGDCAAGVCAG